MRRGLVTALALLSLTLPTLADAATTTPASAVGAATNPFSVGVPTPTATATTPTVVQTPTTSSTSGSFSGLDWILVVGGVVVVIVGICFFVWRDSHKAARHLRRAGLSGSGTAAGGRPGTKPAPRSRKLSAQEKRRRKRGRAPRRR